MTSFTSIFAAGLFALTTLASLAATAGDASGTTKTSAAADTLYVGLGQAEGIRRIVDDLLVLVLGDARIKATFDDVEIAPLKKKLSDQLCRLAGGPCAYRGKDMTLIHQDLGITQAQFNALAEDLQLAMDKNGIPSRIQNRLIARLAPMQREIVTR